MDRLLEERQTDGGTEILLQWEGFDEPTWEPENCVEPTALQELRQAKEKNSTRNTKHGSHHGPTNIQVSVRVRVKVRVRVRDRTTVTLHTQTGQTEVNGKAQATEKQTETRQQQQHNTHG